MRASARENMAATNAENKKLGEYERDLRWFLSAANGRRLMRRWLVGCGVFTSSYAGAEGGEFSMAFNEGRKDWAYKRMAEAKRMCPDLYMLMMKEGLDA